MSTTRKRIREAAIRLFAGRGFAATGIRELAQEAGISSSVLYHYFPTKDELLVELMREGVELLLNVAQKACVGVEDTAARLAILTHIHIAVQAHDPFHARVVDSELRALTGNARAEIIALRDQYEHLWEDTLEQGLREKVFHFLDPHLTRLALLEMCNGVAFWYSPLGVQTLETIAQTFADLVLGAVDARRENSRLRVANLSLAEASSYIDQVEQAFQALQPEQGEEERT